MRKELGEKADAGVSDRVSEKARVTEAWSNFISYCRTQAPHCEISVRIVNGEPTDLLDCKSKVRFDKVATIPKG